MALEQNHYSFLLNYIKSFSDSDVFVNTITQGITEDIDLDKGNILPLLNVEIFDPTFPPNTITFQVEVTVLDIRDINKNEEPLDKFMLTDNKIDNFNETLAVVNRIVGKMRKDFGDTNISINTEPGAGKMEEWGKNLLDGWQLLMTVTMPNTTINLCS